MIGSWHHCIHEIVSAPWAARPERCSDADRTARNTRSRPLDSLVAEIGAVGTDHAVLSKFRNDPD